MSGQMASVRRNYGVPVKRGARVIFRGLGGEVSGRIVSSTGAHLYMRRDDNGRRLGPLHPTWEMDYGDGRDHGAETDARYKLFGEWLNGHIERDEYIARYRTLPKVPSGHPLWGRSRR